MIKRALGFVMLATFITYAGAGCEDDNPGDGGTNCTSNCTTLDASGGSSDASQGGDAGSATGAAGFCAVSMSQCIDYDTYDTPSATKGCEVIHGTYSATGTCPHTDSAGGCKQTFANGAVTTTWYYAPLTADDVAAQCKNDANAVYVAP